MAEANGRAAGPGRDDDRKLFVGGLGRNTSETEIKEYFSQFGEVESVNIKMDPATRLPRGFAFVVFTDAQTIDNLLAAGDHYIGNKKVDPKKITKKVNPLKCKIFVGGLTSEMTEQEIKDHFSQYGTITEFQQPFDKMKNQKKGFCFIQFDDDSVAYQVLKDPKQVISGKEVDVKKVKFNPETMGGRGGRNAGYMPRGGGYANSYGYTAADYYGAAAYDGYGASYAGYDYSAVGYPGSYGAQGYGGGKYRENPYSRHAPY
ncbi:unnamed protein product [Bemisia tabaci]|uniref:RRM domain-containing protein n=1 Tax=Bemisia tabaci TaxID=7038 RepID=A0A9P0AP47_BEMTA|nr:PREDICTED: RNA-binding protein squid-like [Bemisia tabaci]CAH0396058.1 unnamed protein product [Bemisia tabaci]